LPYFVSSIIAIVSAMIILFTRYEADDSAITGELEKMKSMFITIDGFVNTYIQSGGDLSSINFEELDKAKILSENIGIIPSTDNFDKSPADDETGQNASKINFPKNEVLWQLIPNKDVMGSYKLMIDMRKNQSLMSKAIFSESFSGREFCEKMLLGTLERKTKTFNGTDDFIKNSGTEKDGYFVCIVFK